MLSLMLYCYIRVLRILLFWMMWSKAEQWTVFIDPYVKCDGWSAGTREACLMPYQGKPKPLFIEQHIAVLILNHPVLVDNQRKSPSSILPSFIIRPSIARRILISLPRIPRLLLNMHSLLARFALPFVGRARARLSSIILPTALPIRIESLTWRHFGRVS